MTDEVLVYVDQNGKPVSTVALPAVSTTVWSTGPYTTISHTTSTSTTSTSTPSTPAIPLTSAASSTSSPPPPPAPTTTPLPPSPPPVVPASTEAHVVSTPSAALPPVPPAPSSTTKPAVKGSTAPPPPPKTEGYGFSYSPYLANRDCKSAQQVATDFNAIPDIAQYSVVRIYGTDCNQVATVLSAAKAHKLKVFAGIFDLGTLSSEVQTIISAAHGDWSNFDTISVGNELVNGGVAAPSAVIAAVGSARSQLRAAGYNGPVVTVDTLVASRANPSLCDASDYCAVNCHPFFDGGVTAGGSGDFLNTQIGTLRDTLSNKNQRIVITETGWPWKGSSNLAAIPSVENQQTALSSIKSTFASHPQDVVLFTTYNDLWKTSSSSTFFADQYWGFAGYAPSG
jgi:exo-beta-1,3-glucanase (GH17 family)